MSTLARVARSGAGAEGRHILIVDDVPMFRELESLFLARYGHVRTAANGAQALAAVQQTAPDVVVLDLHLPDRRGDLLCREIQAQPGCENTAIIVVTSGRPEEHARAVLGGAADVIAKPITRGSLVESVCRFMGALDRPRGLPRASLETDVRLRVAGDVHEGRTRNVSRGGLFVESSWVPQGECELALEFALPNESTPFAPTARMVWERKPQGGLQPGMGLRFLALDASTARELDAYVHERSRPGSGQAEGHA